jgi:hypothetical protein
VRRFNESPHSIIATPDGLIEYAFDANGQLLSAAYFLGESGSQPNEVYSTVH